MWSFKIVCVQLLMMCVLSTHASAQLSWVAAESDFDSGLDGWTFTSGIIWSPGGGNPGGFLRFEDDGPPLGGIVTAPAEFLGDWREYDDNGVLRYDYRIIEIDGAQFPMGRIDLSGPRGAARWLPPSEPRPYAWRSRFIPIRRGEWVVLSGTWDGLMSNVTSMRISLAASSVSSEVCGLDNVVLTYDCVADADDNGELDIFDFIAFQNQFALGDPAADIDGDGSLTLFDFLAFQNAFDAGCP
ncbi:MAG: GC-type dockerin domain-anchored protein [Phycisphaerales bacterium]